MDQECIIYLEALIHLWHNLSSWSYVHCVKKNQLHFHQNISQDWSSLYWQHTTLLPLKQFVISFLSEELVPRYLLMMNYVPVCRFIMTGAGSYLPGSTVQAFTVPEASYSNVLFYSYTCCWLYYIELLTYGTHLLYPSNSFYVYDWLQNPSEFQCIWQLLHNSASVFSMEKTAGCCWWGGDLHKVMLVFSSGLSVLLELSWRNWSQISMPASNISYSESQNASGCVNHCVGSVVPFITYHHPFSSGKVWGK